MKLKDQVCSLELAKKLKELGVKQESYCYWAAAQKDGIISKYPIITTNPDSIKRDIPHAFIASAFTAAELGEIFKSIDRIEIFFHISGYVTQSFVGKDHQSINDNMANSMAGHIIYLNENKLLVLPHSEVIE